MKLSLRPSVTACGNGLLALSAGLFLLLCSTDSFAGKRFWINGSGYWNSSSNWSMTSGGPQGATIPTMADTVIFDANSFTGPNDSVSVAPVSNCARMVWMVGSWTPKFKSMPGDTLFVGGALILDQGMSLAFNGAIVFQGGGSDTINTRGMIFGGGLVFDGTGMRRMMAPLRTVGDIILRRGTLYTQGFMMDCNNFIGYSQQQNTRLINLDTSTVFVRSLWDFQYTAGLSFIGDSSRIMLEKQFGSILFFGGGLTYGEVICHAGNVTIRQGNAFNVLKIDTGWVYFDTLVTHNFNDILINGQGNPVYIRSNYSGMQANLASDSGRPLCWDNVDAADINLIGVPCNAANSFDGGNNTGIVFSPCPPPLDVNISDTMHVSCNGAADGRATAIYGGGYPPYMLQWDDPLYQTTDTAFNLGPGTYNVRVIDSVNDTAWAAVTILEPPILMANAGAANVNCNGACDGSATAAPTGGMPPYTYMWNDPGSQTAPTAAGLCPGTYVVTVTDNNGCQATQGVNVSEPTAVMAATGGNNASCNAACNGAAYAMATGGTPPYTFLWDDAATTANDTIANVCAGTYTVIVTDANGCSDTAAYSVNEPAALTATAGGSNATCFGACDGTASVTGNGGSAPYTYQWNDPSSSVSGSVSGLCAGNWTATVTDNYGCTATASFMVSEPAPLALTMSKNDETCGSANGSATATPSGGTPAYTYLWDAAAGGQTSPTATGLTAGAYNVTVTDANGCSATDFITVGQTGGPSVTTTPTNVNCNGACDGSAAAGPTGGTPPYTYQWDAAAGSQTGQTATGLCAGTYVVTVTDATPCSAVDTVVITEPSAITVTISPINASCPGACNGSATATPTGGTPPYTYVWTNPSGQNTPTVTGLCPGPVAISVSDANGCWSPHTDSVGATASDPVVTGNVSWSGGGANGLEVKVFDAGGSGGQMPVVDSAATDASGNFSFAGLAPGTYILHAATDTTLFPNTMSTYHDTAFRWEDASLISVICDDTVQKNIVLVEFPPQAGNGRLAGTITKSGPVKYDGGSRNKRITAGTPGISGDPIPDVDVTLKSKPGSVVKGHTKTNGSGYYEFTGIEPGSYDLWVDIPGLPMDSTYEVNVTASDTDFTFLDFVVDTDSIYISLIITSTPRPMPGSVPLAVFPNPYSEQVTVIYTLETDGEAELAVYNVLGERTAVLASGPQKAGTYRHTMNAAEHQAGILFIRLTAGDRSGIVRIVRIR